MPNVGPGELLVILAIALLLFGPKKLPEIGKGIGNALREFNKAKNDFMDTIHTETSREEDYGSSYSSSLDSGDTPRETHAYTGSSEAASGNGHAQTIAADHADALPYGADFYAVEGESQPSFRTAQAEDSAGTAAHSTTGYRPAAETANAGSGEGKG